MSHSNIGQTSKSRIATPEELSDYVERAYPECAKKVEVMNDICTHYMFLNDIKNDPVAAQEFLDRTQHDLEKEADQLGERTRIELDRGTTKSNIIQFFKAKGPDLVIGTVALIIGTVTLVHFGVLH